MRRCSDRVCIASSTITEFHSAIGQYINYRLALEENDAERLLYLAIPREVHRRFFQNLFIQKVIDRNQIPPR